jgi:hypothetical protein
MMKQTIAIYRHKIEKVDTSLLFIPQMIYEHGEPWWNDTDRENQKNS